MILSNLRNFNITHFAQAHSCLSTSSAYQGIQNQEQFSNFDIDSDSIVLKLRETIRQLNVESEENEIGMEEWNHKFKF